MHSETIAVPEPDLPDNRLNEGRVAPDGSFWVGTMQDNLTDEGKPKPMTRDSGAYYRIGADLARETADAAGIRDHQHDGVAARRPLRHGGHDEERALRLRLRCRGPYDCEPARFFGRLRSRTARRLVPRRRGLSLELPCCRRCLRGALCAGRSVDRVVDLPCTWPTSCAFGGPDLTTLFVTSARFTMKADHLARNPLEGGLFALETGVAGRLEPLFGG